ncbi:MAG: MBL fold metallo-hydrolase [Rubrivivax sp.]|nr:MBL fold metallo-hydrolase [Rubrivivax sp.]
MQSDPLHGLQVFERGWLSSNNVLIHPAAGEPGAVLVDTSHVNHADLTLSLVREALAGRPLARIVNTHLHSDHCGGNATLQRAFGVPIDIPPGQADAVARWDDAELSYQATGQRMERFRHDAVLQPGVPWRAGGRDWEVIAAPGHDPHMVMLFDRSQRVLISADALWENGFGLVFPEIAGEPGFDDVAAVLDRIEQLDARIAIPGHGAPFGDVPAALARARSRLAAFRADPDRHLRHGIKVLLKYHLMEERVQHRDAARDWALTMPLFRSAWQQLGGASAEDWFDRMLAELVQSGALRLEGDRVHDVAPAG